MDNYDSVRDLTPIRQDWKIRVRVLRKWVVRIASQLHIIFADNQGVKIEAIINDPHRVVFDAQLRQGDWTTIENFRVFPVIRFPYFVYPTTHRYMIMIEYGTDTQIRNVYPSVDPEMFYDFSNVSRILNGGYRLDYSVDLIGVVRRVYPMEELQNIRFFLTDSYHVTVECVAQGVLAHYVERMWGVTGEEFPLCVFRFGRIERRAEGPGYRVTTTIFSQILLDGDTPDLPEVNQLRDVFPSSMNT